MNRKVVKYICLLFLYLLCGLLKTEGQRNVYFCGERSPVHKDFVAEKLMNVIRRQIGYVNMPLLRQRVKQYMPVVEYWLNFFGLPQDLKYIPIVESGFISNATSTAAAHGFWQIMPQMASRLGLIVNDKVDQREDINESSKAACRILREDYLYLKRRTGYSSWVLTAAAFNTGGPNMQSKIRTQGSDYFSMQLNPETALYVYKIIAVKELFEYPEIYMKSFGYNVFSSNVKKKDKPVNTNDVEIGAIEVDIKLDTASKFEEEIKVPKYVAAEILGKYKDFEDGQFVKVKLTEPLETAGGFSQKGLEFRIPGWIIDDRVFFDLGYGRNVTLCDKSLNKGILLSDLKNIGKKGFPVLVKNTEYGAE